MLISMSYYLGESSRVRYFDNYSEMTDFISKYLTVDESDHNMFEVTIYRGKEETRVRGLIGEYTQ